jgi:hypothetical protein
MPNHPLILIVFALGALLSGLEQASAQTRLEPGNVPRNAEQAVRSFLRSYLGQQVDTETRFSCARVALNTDEKRQVIVYVSGPKWCGTSGCTMLILQPANSSFRVVTRITAARLPVRVLASTSNGWRDVGVWVQGGGIQPGYEAALRFNGKTYPRNPSVPPARRLREGVSGEVVIPPSEKGVPLNP